MHRFIGADRNHAGDVLKHRIVGRGKGLLDELDASRLCRGQQALEV